LTPILPIVVIGSFLLIAYTYVIYPLAIWLLAQIFNNGRNKLATMSLPDDPPSVAVIIAAYIEEKDIDARVTNVLESGYPSDRLTVYIDSDGSIDRTNEILAARLEPQLRSHLYDANCGKPSVLNDLVESASADILVFTDTNTFFQPDAIQRLVQRFLLTEPADAVCGKLQLIKPGRVENEDNLYWKYENRLKSNEARIGCLLGDNGAIYAIRRKGFTLLQTDSIVGDFLIVQRLSANGAIVDYEPKAIAVEEISPHISDEVKRRALIGHGNSQKFFRNPEFLPPLHPLGTRVKIADGDHNLCGSSIFLEALGAVSLDAVASEGEQLIHFMGHR
jgi:cellulose synthase/poly-beta-1,6-N-acetylglucosamine synthase-like glycosyltransferase